MPRTPGGPLQAATDALLTKVRRKYKEYGINEKPFVVIKPDNGTYGMGIMTVRDAKELDALNRKTKNKMAVIKDGQTVSDVIIQEGVLTQERVNDAVAEPGGLHDGPLRGRRFLPHARRARVDENLNSPGASFVPLAFEHSTHMPQPGVRPGGAHPTVSICMAWWPAWPCWRPATSWKPPTRTPRCTTDPGCSAAAFAAVATPGLWAPGGVVGGSCCGATYLIVCTEAGRAAQNSAPQIMEPDRREGPPGASVQKLFQILAGGSHAGAIGVVYGDIGTSVLYAVKEVFGSGHVPFTHENIYGILSIFFLDPHGHRVAQVRGAGAARGQQR